MTIIILITSGGSGGTGMGDTSVLKLVRLVRLTRMARMAKLLRAVPELIILIKGIAVASRSVSFTLILLNLIVYFFAIVFRQLCDGTDLGDQYFKSVPDAMLALLLDGVMPDQSAFVRDVGDESAVYGMMLLFFILMASLTVMNMLVGVLVEVVSVVSSVEKEQLTVTYVKQRLVSMFGDMDADGSMMISKEEFGELIVHDNAARIINEIGVDVVGLVDLKDFIFKDGHEINFNEFMELVLSLRGQEKSSVKDIVDLRKFTKEELLHTKDEILQQVTVVLETVNQNLNKNADMIKDTHRRLSSEKAPLLSFEPVVQIAPDASNDHDALSNIERSASHERRKPVTPDYPEKDRKFLKNASTTIVTCNTANGLANSMVGDRPVSEASRLMLNRPGSAASLGSRPGSVPSSVVAISRPGSAASNSAIAKLRTMSELSGSAKVRGASPTLGEFPKHLWIGEDMAGDDDDEAEWTESSNAKNRGTPTDVLDAGWADHL